MSTRRRRHKAPLLQDFLQRYLEKRGETMLEASLRMRLSKNTIERILKDNDDCMVPADPETYRKLAEGTQVSLDTMLWMAGYRDKDPVLDPVTAINDILIRAGYDDTSRSVITGVVEGFRPLGHPTRA